MNTLPKPIIHRASGVFTVKLSSVGNPDFRQDPNRSLYGVPEATAHVQTIEEARDLCRCFIAFFNVGGGNWSGGEVVRVEDGLVIGSFSYNGRFWAVDGTEIPTPGEKTAAQHEAEGWADYR